MTVTESIGGKPVSNLDKINLYNVPSFTGLSRGSDFAIPFPEAAVARMIAPSMGRESRAEQSATC